MTQRTRITYKIINVFQGFHNPCADYGWQVWRRDSWEPDRSLVGVYRTRARAQSVVRESKEEDADVYVLEDAEVK
jgi:hypothetical protein